MKSRPLAAAFHFFCVAVVATGLARVAHAQQVFEEAKAVGREMMTLMLWVSGVIAAMGFMGVGHAFSVGDIHRGKALLRGTVIGTTCIFGAAGVVQFIRAKSGQPAF